MQITLHKTSHNRPSTETTMEQAGIYILTNVLQYCVCFRNKGLTRVRSKAPNPGEKIHNQIQEKKSAIKSRKRNPRSNLGKEIRNQIQEKKSEIITRKRNPQSNPGKEIRNQIQEKKSAIKSRRRNSQSHPGKEILNQIQKKRSAIKSRKRNLQSKPRKEIRNKVPERNPQCQIQEPKILFCFRLTSWRACRCCPASPRSSSPRWATSSRWRPFVRQGFQNIFKKIT